MATPRLPHLHEPNPLLRLVYDAFFSHIHVDEAWVRDVRQLASRGSVVYILRNLNFVDFMALDYLTKAYDLPRIGYVNDVGLWILNPLGQGWLHALLPADGVKEATQLRDALDAGRSAVLFLKRPPSVIDVASARSRGRGLIEGDAIVHTLINMQRLRPRPINLVPQVFVWTKRPDTRGTHWLDPLLGPREWPGALRTLGQFLTNYKFVELKAGEALDLKRYLADAEPVSDEVHVRRIVYAVLRRLERERRSVTGPAGKPPDRARHQVLESPYLRSAIEALGEQEKRGELRKRALKILDSMQATPDSTTIRALELLLDRVFHRIYAGINIDVEGLRRVREAAKESTLVLLPCHKSHIDYLVLSYVFYEQNLPLPMIAAGDNLSFMPLGPILRRAGAFFIRRSFRGDDLYAPVVEAYVRRLMRDGHAVEVFLEGGRSRTGKLLPPKFGILNMLVRAAASLPGRRVSFVPISIGYERIVETDSYGRELTGGDKHKEDATGLLKTTEVLRHRYGEISLQFGNFMTLDDIRAELGLPSSEMLAPEQSRQICVRLANRTMDEINRVTAVSPGALLALALLSDHRRGIEHSELIERCRQLLHLPLQLRARLTPSLLGSDGALREQAIADAIEMFLEAGALDSRLATEPGKKPKKSGKRRAPVGLGTVYRVPERKRLELDNSKNAIVHFFVERGLIATAVLMGAGSSAAPAPLAAVRDRVRDLSRLFKHEFRFRADASFDTIYAETVASMVEAGQLAREGDLLLAGPGNDGFNGAFWLRTYASIMQNFLESYRIAARALRVLEAGPLPQKELVRRALAIGSRMYDAAQIDRFEAIAQPMLQNAFHVFVDEGYLHMNDERYELSPALVGAGAPCPVEARIACYLPHGPD
jgi:glycerol-3-phosphate O-acyltransferase